MVTQQIRKVGNSFVVTIPKAEMQRLELDEGDYISIDLRKMELKPVLDPTAQAILDEDMPNLLPMLEYLKDR